MSARQTLLDTAAEDLAELATLTAMASVELRQASKARPDNAEAMKAAAEAVLAQAAQLSLCAGSTRAIAERLHCVSVYESDG